MGRWEECPAMGFCNRGTAIAARGFGFLQYFTAAFYGDLEEVELAVNNKYPGT
jgi:hypothetical protein